MGKRMIVVTGALIGLHLYGYHVIPDYRIQSSISFESPSGRETMLNVVVFKDYYNKELWKEIEKFYLDMNGYPAVLQMNLYVSGQKKPHRTEKFEC